MSESEFPNRIQAVFGIDLRSLAALRISLGTTVILDSLNRLPDLTNHYSEVGIYPNTLRLLELESFAGYWSLNLLNGNPWFQLILFVGLLASAVCLALGLKTKLSNLCCWVLIYSLHVRNPDVNMAGDTLLRLLIFWLIFLPSGKTWSLDRSRTKYLAAHRTTPVCSTASAALLVQVAVVYFFNAFYKSGPMWRESYSAIEHVLQLESFVLPFGDLLSNQKPILGNATKAVIVLEQFGPAVCFLPFWTAQIRIVCVAVFLSFHLIAIGLTIDVGIFPLVSASSWLVFLPGRFWQLFSTKGVRKPCISPRNKSQIERKHSKFATRLSNPVAGTLLLLVLIWNIDGVNPSWRLPKFLRIPTRALGLTQKWNQFAPNPTTKDAWFVCAAVMPDGSQFDPLTGEAPDWTKPEDLREHYRNFRWRMALLEILSDEEGSHRMALGEYVHRVAEAEMGSIESLKIFAVVHDIRSSSLKSDIVQIYAVN